jgi:hypothetical protein
MTAANTSSYPTPTPAEHAAYLQGDEREALQHAQWCEGWDRTKAWIDGKDVTPVGDHEPVAIRKGREDALRGPYVEE